MKTQKGITIMSIIIYITVMLLVIAVLSIITGFFINNTHILTEQSEYIAEYNKFNMFFIEDVKNNKNARILSDGIELDEEEIGDEIVFDDGTVYTFSMSDKGIYRNKAKICSNIQICSFSKKIIVDDETNLEKKIIEVGITIKDAKVFSPTNEYVLRYW